MSVLVFAAAWWLTGRVRAYALRRLLLDVPNQRSSHSVATPRGGGLAIALTTIAVLPVLGWLDLLARPAAIAMMGGGALAAITGFIDDRRHVPVLWRLLAHFAAAAWVLWWLGGMPPLRVFAADLPLGWLAAPLAAVFVAWLINLTNFMDGIDGIASVEVITVCLGGIVMSRIAAPESGEWTAALVLAAATAGFLVWNWPPAKIFLGDAGSGFLGVMLAALSLHAGWIRPDLFWCWLILMGGFVVDSSVTLLRRMARGERLHEAHRTHAYQHAARRWGGHRPITLWLGVINVAWLLPMAALVAMGLLPGVVAVAVAYTPLVVLAMVLRAGATLS